MRRSTGCGSAARAGQLELAVAAGLDHARLKARAPYDLILANILAGPLIELAPSLAAALAPGGRLILAGLLDRQAERGRGGLSARGADADRASDARRMADPGAAQAAVGASLGTEFLSSPSTMAWCAVPRTAQPCPGDRATRPLRVVPLPVPGRIG